MCAPQRKCSLPRRVSENSSAVVVLARPLASAVSCLVGWDSVICLAVSSGRLCLPQRAARLRPVRIPYSRCAASPRPRPAPHHALSSGETCDDEHSIPTLTPGSTRPGRVPIDIFHIYLNNCPCTATAIPLALLPTLNPPHRFSPCLGPCHSVRGCLSSLLRATRTMI